MWEKGRHCPACAEQGQNLGTFWKSGGSLESEQRVETPGELPTDDGALATQFCFVAEVRAGVGTYFL